MYKLGISLCRRKLYPKNILKILPENPNRKMLFQVTVPLQISNIQQENILNARFKSRVSKSKSNIPIATSESESESENSDILDNIPDKHTKTLKINVLSLRMDAILKAGLGISRNKIETMFYESKVRLNGEKVPKKSAPVAEGDEIDIIKGINISNPSFLTIARLEVLSVKAKEDSIGIKMRICKSLTVENYQGKNAWES
ncbi:mitochondrial transcription rescue factor 1 [Leptinotarsa decemlineata]|uniref:mitochondrial transcription rescue factor 1 n=1 Tax=Leptinotarsa decemlineata TaxID=7539 RepID=UPI000C2555F5|nr:uncharacterized protein C6orf203 homolog [Leptinotarsa decemlineata]